MAGPFTLHASLPADTTTFTDPGLSSSTEYCYQVRAVNAVGPSTFTTALCATTFTGSTTVSFQQGVGGYADAFDTYLAEANPSTLHGSLDSFGWDSDDPRKSGLDTIGLLRFDNIFGSGPGQIPSGSTIVSASLSYEIHNVGHTADLYRAAITWDEGTTFDGFGGTPGVQPEDLSGSIGPVSKLPTGALYVASPRRSVLPIHPHQPTGADFGLFMSLAA